MPVVLTTPFSVPPFSPEDTTSANLATWWDFNDNDTVWTDPTRTIHPTTGQTAGYVDDKVGTFDLEGATGTSTWTENVQNNLAGVVFTGVGSSLKTVTLRTPAISMPFTEFIVYSAPLGKSPTSILHAPSGGCPALGTEQFTVYHQLADSDDMLFYNDGQNVAKALGTNTSGAHMVSMNWKTSGMEVWRDGASKTVVTKLGTGVPSNLTLRKLQLNVNCNGTGSADSTFLEVLFYDGELSPADRVAVETYLNNKWAIF